MGRSGRFPFSSHLHLSAADRTTHLYVIGLTGQGKSKFLQHGLFQDITAGRGCGVLDPHTDLVH
ncbi:MAG: type IV secretory system conjugative DNA transfer family protein, partial [Chloroflexi bacterium]|nr:type IV secretory system conjugative DNA transfer family protein [Chloroflexota bacterium]